jgi:putative hemolysin
VDDPNLSSFAALAALIAFQAWLQFSYAVLINIRRTPLFERAESGERSAKNILRLADDLPRLYITNQLALMFTRIAIIAIAVIALADPLVAAQTDDNPARDVLIYAAVLVPIALLTYLFADLLPAAYGNAYSDQAASIVTAFMRPLMILFKPLTIVMIRIQAFFSRISGSEALDKAITEEEIMTLVDVGEKAGAIEDEEKEMIYSVLQFGETLVREIMIPRPDISAVAVSVPLTTALREIIESGHSRIPVYEDTIDDIKGILYAKDLLLLWQRDMKDTPDQPSVRSLMRPAFFVPETKRADMLFREMQQKKMHIAVIVDEYGGTAGLVTIEDLIEEIVGDIQDEFDTDEEADYVQLGENAYLVDGGMNLDDLNELLDVELPTDENDSIGGYIYSALGRVPDVGEILTLDSQLLQITVEAVENRRIRKVRIEKIEPPPKPIEDAEPERGRPRDTQNGREVRATTTGQHAAVNPDTVAAGGEGK